MKTLFIESKAKNIKTSLSKKDINKLPKKLLLLYSLQYKELAESIKKQLIASKIRIERFQQVLGCTTLYNNQLPILLIGTGKFHAINLYLQAPIIYRLENNKITKVSSSEIKEIEVHKKSALIKFLSADNIGILVSTKPGQEHLNQAIILKEKLNKKGKQAFIFISNEINTSQFENFNINSWVNTACSGLSFDDSRIININEISN